MQRVLRVRLKFRKEVIMTYDENKIKQTIEEYIVDFIMPFFTDRM